MSEPELIRRQQALLRDMQQLVASRKSAIDEAESRLVRRNEAAQESYQQAISTIEQQQATAAEKLERDYQSTNTTENESYLVRYREVEHEYLTLQQRINSVYDAAKAKAKRELQEARWESTTVYDATRHKPKAAFIEIKQQVDQRVARLEQIGNESKQWLLESHMYRQPKLPEESVAPPDETEPLQSFLSGLPEAEDLLLRLKTLLLPRLFRSGAFLWVYIGIGALLAYPIGALTEWQLAPWLGATAATTMILASIAVAVCYVRGRQQALDVYQRLATTLFDTEGAHQRWLSEATAKYQRATAEIRQKHESELQKAADTYDHAKQLTKNRRNQEILNLNEYPPRLAQFKQQHAEAAKSQAARHKAAVAQLAAQHTAALAEARRQHEATLAANRAQHESDWQVLAERWREGWQAIHESAAEINETIDARFPDWDSPTWDTWTPPRDVSPTIRFGRFEVGLDRVPGGVLADQRLATNLPDKFLLPALLSFPRRCSMLLRGGGSGRVRSVEALQAVMLRFLMGIPPGKLRFTIIDPVGLGQNFAGFMHLADYDEQLVHNKIWTEPQQIEQRLSELTQHMSNVIQKYLRNEYETIEDYNRHAGEVAEPFRLLVAANFPFNFTDAATRHLVSIASTGSRCGVYTLVSVDPKLPLPHGFRMVDLEEHAIKMVWRETNFAWKEEPYEKYPLKLDAPPPNDQFSRLVHLVGEGAKDANRVEVPFEFIAPDPSKWWTGSTASGLDVPLGRAGATKRQHMRLGRGTAQHVLVAGKTGSGKSTLLHALITNTALTYSPDEVELYLVDFKKGVEFKTYANYALPHARVIAVESEREFGLSVLERLDEELRLRGERFRDLGVQDLAGYRQAAPQAFSPRILLVVDEFQEFFTEDDKIAQDASLLLDRLVRQGRAFGIHIHLGSQTLGGAYGLARSTLGQMAVRIALQCSEADANLILSEENSAARLLSRPGEAIYNDANGRSEGNNMFQVVWLSDDRREEYLRRLAELARERGTRRLPQIVFEGNVPADIGRNTQLDQLLSSPAWPTEVKAPQFWLGEAIAIKDPTALAFRRQSGANLLILGQQAEAALAMLSVGIVSLAAQYAPPGTTTKGSASADSRSTAAQAADNPQSENATVSESSTQYERPAGVRFVVLDAQPEDAPHAGTLARLGGVVPHAVEVVGPRDTARIVAELAAELERRSTNNEFDAPPIFVVVYDLARLRELRKGEDDFGFSREEKPSPAKQFVQLLREGPSVGIHTLLWCDTLNNLNRMFERGTLREFENRVLFQMSVADSSSLIDSPAASRLGPNRAFLHSEEQGKLEKFRPYSLPAAEWLAWVASQLHSTDRPEKSTAKHSG